MLRPFRFLVPAFALAFALTGCDATDAGSSSADAQADTEDAAVSIAAAIALDGGGVLDEIATAAISASRGGPEAAPPNCRSSHTYDETAVLYTVTRNCERGASDSRYYATFSRTSTYQFLNAGQPQPSSTDADALAYDILSGQTLVRTPSRVHRLTSLTADFEVTDLNTDLVTVNGTSQRSGADSLRTFRDRRGERTVVYTLDLEATDVQGPRRVYENWRRAVAGTLSGHYVATVTRTGRDGQTETREIDRTFTVTFPRGSAGAEIALDGQRFRADVSTGEIASLM